MMRPKNLYSGLCLLMLLACNKQQEQTLEYVKNDRENYYKRISDAPIDVYCYVNSMLYPKVRRDLCSAITTQFYNNMTLNMSVTIVEGKLDTLEMQSLYFDSLGRPKNDTVTSNLMTRALTSFDIEQIPTLRNLTNEDFVMRLQLERFCPGYSYGNEPEIEKIKKRLKP